MSLDHTKLAPTPDDDGGCGEVSYPRIEITPAMRDAYHAQQARDWQTWHSEILRQLEGGK